MVKTRRQFLKTAGAGTFALGTVAGIAAGKSKDKEQTVTATEAGIAEEVSSLFKEGKRDEAIHLLEKYGVKHESSSVRMPTIGSETSNSQEGFEPASEWNQSASEFNHDSYQLRNNIATSFATWTLKGPNGGGNGGAFETAGPRDGIGITVNPDLWEVKLGSWDCDNRSTITDVGSKGVLAEFNDKGGFQTPSYKRTGHVEMQYEKLEPGSHNVYGSYVHTWHPFGVPRGAISFGLTVGIISFSVNGGRVDTWTKTEHNNV